MDIEPGTRIGADGQRHPAGQEPTDASEYNRRLVRVQGALEDDKVPVWDDEEEAWLLGEGGDISGAVAKSGDTMSGDLVVDGADVRLPNAVVDGGTVTGGVVREGHSVTLRANYTQDTAPTDEAVWPGVKVEIEAVLNDNDHPNPYTRGPIFGEGGEQHPFGPPGTFDIAGYAGWGENSNELTFTPIAFADVLKTGPSDSSDRVMTPAWGFMFSRWVIANGGKLTLQNNDMNRGGASFVSNQLWATNPEGPGGSIDGVSRDIALTSFLAGDAMIGDVHIAGRIGFDMADINGGIDRFAGNAGSSTDGSGTVIDETSIPRPYTSGSMGGARVDKQIGLRVRKLVNGDINIGVENASATVAVPTEHEVEDSGDHVEDIGCTFLRIANTSGAPQELDALPDGEDGQRLLIQVTGDPVTLGDITVQTFADLTWSEGAWHDVAGDAAQLAQEAWDTASAALPATNNAGTLSGGRTALGAAKVGVEFTAVDEADPSVALANLPPVGGLADGGAVLFGSGTGEHDVILNRVEPGVLRLQTGALGPGSIRNLAAPSGLDPSEAVSVAAASGAHVRTFSANASIGGSDVGRTILCTTGLTITLITVTTALWPVGASCRVVQVGTDPVTVAAGPYTLRTPSGATSTAQGQEGILRRLSSTDWAINWL